MTFVSYAQNYEDVMLWRALKHVQNGFYIDVGAAWPDEHSVTRAFYERGWRGINVEPNPHFNELLQAQRPEDVNLKVAVGDYEGVLVMNFIQNTGLSTLEDSIAEQHIGQGLSVDRHDVELKTLTSICSGYTKPGQDIHFLKVDVEGLEEAVLRGNDWTKFRPWVVVVEATLPMSQLESHEGWEPILLSASYLFAYADGLNRFYVAQEHVDLLSALKYPPNVFDEFILASQQQTQKWALDLEQRAVQAEAATQSALEDKEMALVAAEKSRAYGQELEARLHATLTSTSWKITAPLRWISTQLRLIRQQGLKARLRALLKKAIRKATRFTLAHSATHDQNGSDVAALSPKAKKICADLKRKIELEQRNRL